MADRKQREPGKENSTQPKGTLSIGDLQTTEDGELLEVSEPKASHPFEKARIEDGLELKPSGKAGGELRLLNAPKEVKLKPLQLTKRD